MKAALATPIADLAVRTLSLPLPGRRLLTVLLLALLATGGWLLLQSARSIGERVVPLKEVVMQGGDVQSRELVEKQLASQIGASLWHIDLDHYKNLLETMPGIKRALLQRVLPNQLQVLLQASQPLARWDDKVIDSSGRPLYFSEVDKAMPVFRTESHDLGKVAAFYRQVAPLLPVNSIVQVDFDSYGWRVFLASGVLVLLGDEPAQQFRNYVRHKDALHNRFPMLFSVDMRYKHGFAVRLQEEEQS